ncbi:unnamed protein product [Somion occarium]|uniref:Uncharacterized protein n=1 Tax=Somion occarium TaxID=3059160 RepID=A0ABP1E7B4_9APHY
MSRPDSRSSIDTVAAAEALDLFDEQGLSSPSSKSSKLFLGSSPRHRSLRNIKQSLSRRDSPTLPWRRASTDSVQQRTVTPTRSRTASASQVKRPDSPDIDTILKKTPRPRRSSSSVFPAASLATKGRSRSQSTLSLRSAAKKDKLPFGDTDSVLDDYNTLLEKLENDSDSDNVEGSESDSSIDVHTPLPHLMFRDGLLSPRSKLLPQDLRETISYVAGTTNDRSQSVLSVVSAAGSVMTKSGLQKDPRDTERRRVRHRDGQLLRAGMGLTTGLGWSDSEDEDAPSALTRRLIHTTIERKRSHSNSVIPSSRPTSESFSDVTFSRFASPVSMTKPSLSHKAPQSDLRNAAASPSLRSTSVTFPTAGTKFARPMQSLDSLMSRDRADSLSSYSQGSFTRSRASSLASVATQSSHMRERTDSSASMKKGDPDSLRIATKTPTSGITSSPVATTKPSMNSSPTIPSIQTPTSTTRSRANSSAKSLNKQTRTRADSNAATTISHPQADPSLLKLRTIVKSAVVIPPGDKTPIPDSPSTPTTPLPRPRAESSASVTSRSRSGSASASSGLSKPRVVASPARRVEVVSQQTKVEASSIDHVLNAIKAGPLYTSPTISSMPLHSRAESSASTTTSSSYSTDPLKFGEGGSFTSASSSSLVSTAESSSNSGSTLSSSSVPRPLQLPQTAGLTSISRTFSQDAFTSSVSSLTSSSTSTGGSERYQRKRALSGPRPLRPAQAPQSSSSIGPQTQRTSTYPPIGVSQNSGVTYASPAPTTSPFPSAPSASPTGTSPSSPGSPRQRPALIGARMPRPRTGTGMAYRTSSFGNLQDAASRMKSIALVSNSVVDRATASTSGTVQPIRI